jgi:hypothetical protein
VSNGTALWGGLDLTIVLIPSLIIDAMLVRFVCGRARVFGKKRIGFPTGFRVALWAVLFANLALLIFGLRRWGAIEIRENTGPQIMLALFGQLLLLACGAGFDWLGISLRDDAMERRNPAALITVLGAFCAVGLIWTGSNIGEGPSYGNNVFSAALGLSVFLLLWILLELLSNISNSICEERDLGTGLRVGACFLAIGLVFGRALAGDWHSTSGTVRDFFADGWVGILILGIEIVVERSVRTRVMALVYLGIAIAWLGRLGRWEGFR